MRSELKIFLAIDLLIDGAFAIAAAISTVCVTRTYRCKAICGSALTGGQGGHIAGDTEAIGTGRTMGEACWLAEKAARQKSPLGQKTKHCQHRPLW